MEYLTITYFPVLFPLFALLQIMITQAKGRKHITVWYYFCLSSGRKRQFQKIIQKQKKRFNMKSSTSQKTVVFNDINFFTILAVFALTTVNIISTFVTILFSGNNKSNDAETLSASSLTNGKDITDERGFRKFVAKWLSVPGVNLLVRLISGKSRLNLKDYFKNLQTQGYSGTTLINAMWAYLDYVVSTHAAALTSSVVGTYVKNVVRTDMPKGVIMLTIKGTVPVNLFETLAIETLLLMQYGNQKVIITFEVPGIIGLTPFFGNTDAANEFTKQMHNQYTDEEAQYGTAKWNTVGHVVYAKLSNIPEDRRASVLNGTIEATLNQMEAFEPTGKTAGVVI